MIPPGRGVRGVICAGSGHEQINNRERINRVRTRVLRGVTVAQWL